ncbi:hypothetical protein IJ707_05470 [bacterium]|nr:hypothetical protein [bacterium]
MTRLNIKPEYLKMLQDVFEQYCPHAEIWVYGSRIKNRSHDGSDIDMIVKNFNDNSKNLPELKQLLNDSNVPFLMDIEEFDKLPDYFQKEILKDYEIIFKEN